MFDMKGGLGPLARLAPARGQPHPLAVVTSREVMVRLTPVSWMII